MGLAYFVPSKLTFIPADWKDDGTYTEDTWPVDAVLLTQEVTDTYWKQSPPEGKMLGASAGRPAWVDLPAPTTEQIIVQSEQQKTSLRTVADSEIVWRQDAVNEGIATEEETAALAAWKKYRVLLMRVDTSTAPDITWPEQPS